VPGLLFQTVAKLSLAQTEEEINDLKRQVALLRQQVPINQPANHVTNKQSILPTNLSISKLGKWVISHCIGIYNQAT
jgi:hypothetical protein